MKEGFTFVDCGGTKAKYIKNTNIRLVNGNLTCGGCVITNTTKTLSNKEYIEDTEATLKLSNSQEAFKEEKEEMLTMLNTLSEKNFCEMYSIHKIGNTYFMEY